MTAPHLINRLAERRPAHTTGWRWLTYPELLAQGIGKGVIQGWLRNGPPEGVYCVDVRDAGSKHARWFFGLAPWWSPRPVYLITDEGDVIRVDRAKVGPGARIETDERRARQWARQVRKSCTTATFA